jgi:hypothetical protein
MVELKFSCIEIIREKKCLIGFFFQIVDQFVGLFQIDGIEANRVFIFIFIFP